MAVFFKMAALHHQTFFAAVVTLAAVIHNGPGNPIADFQRTISGIMGDAFSQRYDSADDFMPQDDGSWS
jgi:hypothetical protein